MSYGNFRRSEIPVAWRDLPEDLFTLDVTGKRTLRLKQCKKCKKVKQITDFYIKSKSSAGWDTSCELDRLRYCCISCWDAGIRLNKKGHNISEGDLIDGDYVVKKSSTFPDWKKIFDEKLG